MTLYYLKPIRMERCLLNRCKYVPFFDTVITATCLSKKNIDLNQCNVKRYCDYKAKAKIVPIKPKFPGVVTTISESLKARVYKIRSINNIKQSRCCYYSYEKMANEIPFIEFFNDFDMPDTFSSWFTVLELHVYLVSTRLMQDFRVGLVFRDLFIEAMWNDAQVRMTYLDEEIAKKHDKTKKLALQFQAALIGYDEGVQGNDMELAGALWRRFFSFNCNDAQKLERMVKYVRVQLNELSQYSVDEIIMEQSMRFVPLKEI